MQRKNPYILGLDVGTNSIGWAVVDCKKEEGEHKGIYAGYRPVSLRALNSRIFLDMLNAKNKVPKNQERRAARGARNRRTYYKKRRKALAQILMDTGLLPRDYQQNQEERLNEIDLRFAGRKIGKDWCKKTWTTTEKAYRSPYAMRNFALKEKLEPYEFGRLLLHLQRRRGYFSNRGAKYVDLIKSLHLETPEDDENTLSSEEKKEAGPVLAAIGELDKKLNGRTLGQFIWEQSEEEKIPPHRITLFEFEKPKESRGETVIQKLQFRARREMYETEFDAILKKQNTFHELSKETVKNIRHEIFHQRPLQLQKSTVGNCNIYPHKKRSALMRLEYQECRTLQTINNIKIGGELLNAEQRQQLFKLANDPDKLNKSGRIPWKKVAKALGVELRDVNYGQGSDDTNLTGNRTIQAISSSIGIDKWQKLGAEKQKDLVEDLLTMHNKKALYDRLVGHWKFAPYRRGDDPEKGALGLAMNEQLEDGYGKHSLKAINALLPHLRDGLDYYTAMEKIGEIESITKTIKTTEEDYLLKVEDVPNIANPTVQKALYEMRRVINSIVKRYGKPAIIRMEMTRDMKSSKRHRGEIASQQKANRQKNEEAEKEILKYYKTGNPNVSLEEVRKGVHRVSPDDRTKYKMWEFEQEEKCPYCQEHIGLNELFSGEAEIEHILPYTGFRQNYMNTVVSCQSCNQEKGKRTPYEAWGHDTSRWQRIEKFAKDKYKYNGSLYPKQLSLLKKEHSPEDTDEFVERQLNDTRYIATASKKMLEKYGVPIDVNNGVATSKLRGRLGLNNILPQDPDSGVYTEMGQKIDTGTSEILQYSADKAEKFTKSRQDHRHHAVDAFVVAMTDRTMLKTMVELHKRERDNKNPSRQKSRENWIKKKRLVLPESWVDDSSLQDVLKKKLNATVVSHMIKRKVWGALHEETLYGKSHFEQRLNIESMSKDILKKVQKIAEADINDSTDWIADEALRTTLLTWAVEAQKLKPANRALPHWKGEELKEFVYQKSCVVHRKKLTGELLSNRKWIPEQWNPGIGTWIAEKSIHDALFQWLKAHGLVGKKAKEIEALLKETPPRVINKKGETSTPILNVRIARSLTDSYLKIENSYTKPGNNHHFVLFHNGKEGKERKRQFIMATMLEAAKRASAGEPIIIRKPPLEWEGEWHYELDLCVNDMVQCQDISIFENAEKFAPEHKKTPYFRVQKMSRVGSRLNLYLRHHSISGTDSDWGVWLITSLDKINCSKVQIGNLGLLPHDS